jgi:two-component system, LytTR family, sensor kinase
MRRNTRYWLCQILGWGAWFLFTAILVYNLSPDFFVGAKMNLLILALFLQAFLSFLVTHFLRIVLKKIKWFNYSNSKILLIFIVSVIVASFLGFSAYHFIEKVPSISLEKLVDDEKKQKAIEWEKDLKVENTDYYLFEKDKKLDSVKYKSFLKIKKDTGWHRDKNGQWQLENVKSRIFSGVFGFSFWITIWLFIYFLIFFVEKNRNNKLNELKLEGVVKSLELKTIKSHINPHFIFNALNSIRALVDENPARARTAITELSNILRSSLQADKLETVPLEQELDIVQDYLALEHMRFEERLKIEMHIDPDTLKQPIPPMMLQNLVENAIKHGISKDVNGGIIIIRSYFKDNHHEVVVQNTGNLQSLKKGNTNGFGLKSTQDRLNLLYQKKAQFEIEEKNGNMVQSKIIMPVAHIL